MTLERIRHSILAQKAGYWNNVPHAKYGRGYDIFAYLAYQAPGYIIQFHHIIKNLDRTGLLTDDVKVLDLGSGPGVVPLALIWFMKERKKGTLTIDALEQSEEFIEAFKYLVPRFASDSPVTVHQIQQADIRTWNIQKPSSYSMITCQNVLAELSGQSRSEKIEILMKYSSLLSDDGLFILVEPAELRHSTELRVLQRELEKAGLYVYGPCTYLHSGTCNPSECWSFAELPRMQPTKLMSMISDVQNGYRFMNTDIKFTYSILTKKLRKPVVPDAFIRGTIPLSNLDEYIGNMVTIVGAKMSMDIGNQEFAVYLICDGSGGARVYLIIPRSLHNEDIKSFRNADYGDIVKISNVRVRWNQKKGDINLIAGSRTHVSAMHK
ncbi:MAG TPA: small ribosomal subunit Rsm22 family protein [Methanospirillum sp.]|uniref:small ribosomal subunit Rsm22 family protein n=1 Tax=Methanospirillum sp. TaxID=45200 RepID=UPI002CB726CC|nr:small ribosomal subunit Rsm22 family protein [Methanospirillum sp.]HOJ95493.1 small ribosomal subunit Rsm22 family protein [Methanospirillum sp.]HPP78142.1 small ribosomal subunit Rsm22 family protein [Methanospirillum sp.]